MNQSNDNLQPHSIELPEPLSGGQIPSTPMQQDQVGGVQLGHVNHQPIQNQPAKPIPVPDSSTLIADDVDLIEKDWVLKAKAIVAQTVHDPSQQAREMGKMKAEYVKKRYNKDLKTDGAA